MVIGAAAVSHAAMHLEFRRAGREPFEQVMRGEPRRSHPIRPTGKRTERCIDRDWFIALAIQPISKVVDVIGGGT